MKAQLVTFRSIVIELTRPHHELPLPAVDQIGEALDDGALPRLKMFDARSQGLNYRAHSLR